MKYEFDGRDVEIYVDGKPIERLGGGTFEYVSNDEKPTAPAFPSPRVYEGSCETTLSPGAATAFFAKLFGRDALRDRLLRRAWYGGRKGRRATRRLLELDRIARYGRRERRR